MKSRFITLLIIFVFSQHAKGQISYMHGLGSTYNVWFYDNELSALNPHFTYNPRLNYAFNDDFSLSFTTYLSAGVFGHIVGQGLLYGVNIPILFQMNWGQNATKDTDKKIGVHVGAGYDINFFGFGNDDSLRHGPYWNTGIKIKITDKSSLGIRANYVYYLEGFHAPGLGMSFNW